MVAAKLGATMADRRDLWNLGSAFVGQAIVTTASVSMGVWQFVRDLRELVSALVRITAPGGVLDRLADLPDTLRPFAAHAESISESLRQIATLAESLERLSKVAESLPALADRAAALPEVVTLARDLESRVSQIATRMESLNPHVGDLAASIGDLQQSVRLLGNTIGPLQGTAERVGRLVERFPSSWRRAVTGGASESGPESK